MRMLATILIVAGLVAMIYGGVTYTRREKVLDVGPIEATVEKQRTIPMSPVAGAVALIAGVLILTRSGRRTV